MKTYKIIANNRIIFVTAETVQGAREQCMERYGVWPEPDNVKTAED